MYRGLELQRGLVSPLSTPARHTTGCREGEAGRQCWVSQIHGVFLTINQATILFSSTASIKVFIALVLVLLII